MNQIEKLIPQIPPVISLADYQKLAIKFISDLGGPIEQITHATVGLVTEVGELIDLYKRDWVYKQPPTNKKLTDEIGDVLWYLSLGYEYSGLTLPVDPIKEYEGVTRPDYNVILAKLVRYSSNSFCIAHAYPSSLRDFGVHYEFVQLLMNLQFFAEHHNISLLDAAHGNLLKIQKRYPEGKFDAIAAINRNTEHETSHLG